MYQTIFFISYTFPRPLRHLDLHRFSISMSRSCKFQECPTRAWGRANLVKGRSQQIATGFAMHDRVTALPAQGALRTLCRKPRGRARFAPRKADRGGTDTNSEGSSSDFTRTGTRKGRVDARIEIQEKLKRSCTHRQAVQPCARCVGKEKI